MMYLTRLELLILVPFALIGAIRTLLFLVDLFDEDERETVLKAYDVDRT